MIGSQKLSLINIILINIFAEISKPPTRRKIIKPRDQHKTNQTYNN